ncbi:hypothetical protein DFJ73DRAFT_758725 [Zopfochytrium polystomum]|nr:hypothetical protein DFJ73DRAFT_758725 [Zopfochytrium polystomum]
MRDRSNRFTPASQSKQKLQLLVIFLVSAAFLAAFLLSANVAAEPASCLSCGKGSRSSSPLYRALTPADRQRLDNGKSIKASDPKAKITPVDHQSGVKPSQYISMTKDPNVAKQVFNSGHGVVKIDPKKLKGNTVDMQKHPGADKPLARQEQEVLAKKKIPANACTLIGRRDGDGACLRPETRRRSQGRPAQEVKLYFVHVCGPNRGAGGEWFMLARSLRLKSRWAAAVEGKDLSLRAAAGGEVGRHFLFAIMVVLDQEPKDWSWTISSACNNLLGCAFGASVRAVAGSCLARACTQSHGGAKTTQAGAKTQGRATTQGGAKNQAGSKTQAGAGAQGGTKTQAAGKTQGGGKEQGGAKTQAGGKKQAGAGTQGGAKSQAGVKASGGGGGKAAGSGAAGKTTALGRGTGLLGAGAGAGDDKVERAKLPAAAAAAVKQLAVAEQARLRRREVARGKRPRWWWWRWSVGKAGGANVKNRTGGGGKGAAAGGKRRQSSWQWCCRQDYGGRTWHGGEWQREMNRGGGKAGTTARGSGDGAAGGGGKGGQEKLPAAEKQLPVPAQARPRPRDAAPVKTAEVPRCRDWQRGRRRRWRWWRRQNRRYQWQDSNWRRRLSPGETLVVLAGGGEFFCFFIQFPFLFCTTTARIVQIVLPLPSSFFIALFSRDRSRAPPPPSRAGWVKRLKVKKNGAENGFFPFFI